MLAQGLVMSKRSSTNLESVVDESKQPQPLDVLIERENSDSERLTPEEVEHLKAFITMPGQVLWAMQQTPLIYLIHNIKKIIECDKALSRSNTDVHRNGVRVMMQSHIEAVREAIGMIEKDLKVGYLHPYHKPLYLEKKNGCDASLP
jgi:hypothetical protein